MAEEEDKRLERLMKEEQAAQSRLELYEKINEEGIEEKKTTEELIEAKKALAEAILKVDVALGESAETIEAARNEVKKYSEELSDVKKSQDAFSSALGNSIKTFTGVTDSSNTLIGSFLKLRKETGGSAAAFKKAKEQFGKTFTTLNVGVSILQKVTQSTIGLAIANETSRTQRPIRKSRSIGI